MRSLLSLILIFSEFAFGATDVTYDEVEYADLNEPELGPFNCTVCDGPSIPAGYFPSHPYPGMGIGGANGSSGGRFRGDNKSSTLQQTSTLLGKLIDHIPDESLQKGLKEYVKIVNPSAYRGDDVGGSNDGLVGWFRNKFSQNQCYRDAAKSFYKDVAITMSKANKCEPTPKEKGKKGDFKGMELCMGEKCPGNNFNADSEYGCFASRPSIYDSVGQGSKAYLDEGWLWRLALKNAKGSPEAALELIGMCGHDDTAQGRFLYFDDSANAMREIQDKIEVLKNKKAETDAALKSAFLTFDSKKEAVYRLSRKAESLQRRIKTLKDATGEVRNLNCPPGDSDFYLSGSVSSKADIPRSLKSTIGGIQNSDGKTFVPAKNYHIYGSAFLGCKMVANGMTPEQATTVQKQAARMYRGLRMCESSKTELEIRKSLSSQTGVDIENSKHIEQKIMKIWERKNNKTLVCPDLPLGGGFGYFGGGGLIPVPADSDNSKKIDPLKMKKDLEDCGAIRFFGISKLESGEAEIAKRKIATGLSKYDAAVLYDKWYFGGGKVMGTNIPCSDIRYKGPSDLMNPGKSIMGKITKPSGWTDERYKAATQKLATWDVDFKWTVAQHEAGSKFGAEVCSSGAKQSPFADDKACNKPALPGYQNNFNGANEANPKKSVR